MQSPGPVPVRINRCPDCGCILGPYYAAKGMVVFQQREELLALRTQMEREQADQLNQLRAQIARLEGQNGVIVGPSDQQAMLEQGDPMSVPHPRGHLGHVRKKPYRQRGRDVTPEEMAIAKRMLVEEGANYHKVGEALGRPHATVYGMLRKIRLEVGDPNLGRVSDRTPPSKPKPEPAAPADLPRVPEEQKHIQKPEDEEPHLDQSQVHKHAAKHAPHVATKVAAPKPFGMRVTKEEYELAWKLWEEGRTNAEIAEALGRPEGTTEHIVRQAKRDHGIKKAPVGGQAGVPKRKRGGHVTDEERERVWPLLLQEKSVKEIAAIIGRPESTTSHICDQAKRDHGVPKVPSGQRSDLSKFQKAAKH